MSEDRETMTTDRAIEECEEWVMGRVPGFQAESDEPA